MILILILGIALGAASVIFILENSAVVALTFLQWHFVTSIALVVILSMLVGVLLALIFTLPGAIGSSFKMRRLSKHNELLAKEAVQQKQAADEASARLAAMSVTNTESTIR